MKLELPEETQRRTDVEGWVCPVCQGVLQTRDKALHCGQCRQAWPIIDGVPHFINDFPYWGEMPQGQMREINRRARTGNWSAALRDSVDPQVRRAAEMILNLDRANWHWLADLPGNSRVLDVGAGTGTTSHALAIHYREIVAVEPVAERIEFMQERFRQEGLSNIQIVRTCLWSLPFGKESFDLVAMNGVLEWVPQGRPGDPYAAQMSALRDAYSLLRPGGCLYVGIENRAAAGLLRGYPDPHCGLPWVAVLPRPAAHWYARKKGAPEGYRNYLYTSRGYRKVIKAAGFRRVEVYIAIPSYNYPRFFIPIDSNLFSYYVHNFTMPGNGVRRLAREVLLKLKLLKQLEYSFAILAYK